MSQTVGVVGLGNIGGAVARRLLGQGYRVAVYDVDQNKVNELQANGADAAPSMRELANSIPFLITSLPDDRIVLDVWSGDGGILQSAPAGVTLIELSTILPQTMEQIAAQAQEKGIRVLDSPISGGPLEVQQGTLGIIAAGEEGVFKQCTPILNAFAKDIHYVGPQVGQAKAVKLINNMMTMGNVLVAAEAFSLGMQYGIPPEKLYAVLSQTGGRSHHFVKRFPKVLNEDYSAWFALRLGKKDLELAVSMAEYFGKDLAVAKFVQSYYQAAFDEGLADEDIVSVIKLFRK